MNVQTAIPTTKEMTQYVLKTITKQYFLKQVEISPSKSSIRFDVIALRLGGKDIRIYEIKQNRRDFISDDKWRQYLPFCTHFYFVAPRGVIHPDTLPPKIGLIEIYKENGKLRHTFVRKCKKLRKSINEKKYLQLLEGIIGRYIGRTSRKK